MKFSYSWLQSFFVTKLPSPQKLAEALTQRIFETEALSKKVLEVDVLPNRAAECLSYLGLAREIGAILGQKYKNLDCRLNRRSGGKKTSEAIEVKVQNTSDCQRYSARLIEDIEVKESPSFIKERLQESGLRPINNIVDLANYVMLETGQPLHVFDLDKIEEKKLIIRQAREEEVFTTLDDETYSLDKEVLVIADVNDPLAIAGVKGGKKAEITRSTKRIIVESANFSRASVRGIWKKFGLRTDASWRFENGLDLDLVKTAQDRFSNLVTELYQATPALDIVDFYPSPAVKQTISFSLEYLEKLSGAKIKNTQVLSILKRLGFQVIKKSTKQWKVTVPSWRLDILGQEDIIEEVVRLYGYENISSQASMVNLIPPVKNWNQFWEKEIKNTLIKLGLSEVCNYSFINEEQRKLFSYAPEEMVEIVNPVSQQQRYLRPSLLVNLLMAAKENRKHSPDLKFFEIGKVFNQQSHQYLEKSSLAGILSSADSSQGFYRLKGIVEQLFSSLVINDLWFDNYQATPEDFSKAMWHPSRVAEIKVGDKEIGFLGEIHPRLEDALKIPEHVLAFTVDLESLIRLASTEQEYKPVSSYPAAKRDLSVIVPASTKIGKIIEEINHVGGPFIRDIDLVEIYQGEAIPQGKQSVTLRIYFQAQDHTLQTGEISGWQTKIINSLQQKGWIIKD